MFNLSTIINTAGRGINDLNRKMPFAIAVALTKTAKDIQTAEQPKLRQQIDRPTSFTERGIAIQPATKERQFSAIYIRAIQAAYLKWQIQGGRRPPKGKAIPVPIKLKTNQYGNMPRGAVSRAAARKDSFSSVPLNNKTAHLRPGIYKRTHGGRRLELMVAFEDKADYAPIYRFGTTTPAIVQQAFPQHLREAITRYVR